MSNPFLRRMTWLCLAPSAGCVGSWGSTADEARPLPAVITVSPARVVRTEQSLEASNSAAGAAPLAATEQRIEASVAREELQSSEAPSPGNAASGHAALVYEPPRAPERRVEPGSEPWLQGYEPPLPSGTLVFHFGDSFAGSLGPLLNQAFAKVGVRGILDYETATYITTWAWDRDIERRVANVNPDLVLITLGANEIELVDPQQRAKAVQKLVAQLRGRPCAWIAPPLWEQDTGLLQVVRENCAPCAFLNTTAYLSELPRKRDGIHPSREGQEVWAELVFRWLQKHRRPSPERPWNLERGL